MESFHPKTQTKFILLKIIVKMEENLIFKAQLAYIRINGQAIMKKINNRIKIKSKIMIIMIIPINNKDKKVM